MRVDERWHQPDRDQKAAVPPGDQIETSEILGAAAAGNPHGIAAGEFGDIRREVAGFERNFRVCAADVHGERAVLTRRADLVAELYVSEPSPRVLVIEQGT